MKKASILLFATLGLIGETKAQMKFGIQAGLNESKYTEKESMNGVVLSPDFKYKTGFRVGVVADFELKKNLSLQPSISYVTNGTKFTFGTGTDAVSLDMNVNSIEVPINLNYKMKHWFIGAGPYMAFNMSGKGTVSSPDTSYTKSLSFGTDSTNSLRKLDIGLGANVGYQFDNGIFLKVHLQTSLLNLAPKNPTVDGVTVTERNTNFGFTAGYYFKTKKRAPESPVKKP